MSIHKFVNVFTTLIKTFQFTPVCLKIKIITLFNFILYESLLLLVILLLLKSPSFKIGEYEVLRVFLTVYCIERFTPVTIVTKDKVDYSFSEGPTTNGD